MNKLIHLFCPCCKWWSSIFPERIQNTIGWDGPVVLPNMYCPVCLKKVEHNLIGIEENQRLELNVILRNLQGNDVIDITQDAQQKAVEIGILKSPLEKPPNNPTVRIHFNGISFYKESLR